MSNSSITALKKQVESGQLKSDMAYILKIVKDNTINKSFTTLHGLRSILSIKPIHQRLSDLEGFGLIYKDGDVDIDGSNFSIFKYEFNEFKQAKRRIDVKHEKFLKTVKALLNSYNEHLSDQLKRELNNALEFQTELF